MADDAAPTQSTAEGNAPTPAKKPKRVRTGCLTCRERHLKCDEGLPNCQNCCKSNRVCKRGVRLNFIDTQVQQPPHMPQSVEWTVQFLDESRDIASEYKGGLSKYGQPDPEPLPMDSALGFDFSTSVPPAPIVAHQALPPIQGMLIDPFQDEQQQVNHHQQQQQVQQPQQVPQQFNYDQSRHNSLHSQHQHAPSHAESTYSNSNTQGGPQSVYSHTERNSEPAEETREYLTSQEEVLFMQVFVEEVGLWMDSMDPAKHFSRLLPFHSLNEPMLLNAFLACGARHLALVNPKYKEDKALHYYDTATRFLLNSLQNPNRDTVICATTAVILNVYEIMCERALQRMNHIAGARALIKECGWNARSTGIGAACFWLNVGMELLSCLHFNWQVAWDPDDWGVDMDLSREVEAGKEEIWTYRIVYIVGKICNFRASIPRTQAESPHDESIRRHTRYLDWKKLKDWCDMWNANIPRTMHPMAYLHPGQTISQSAFPEVWLIKRTTIVARLFYHTALVLLAQINPLMPLDGGNNEMSELQNRHSQQICGIVAHVKDRGVASVALRSLNIAAECLTSRREQEEVLTIFTKIRQETGWNVGFVYKELKSKWGWNDNDTASVHSTSSATTQQSPHAQAQQQQQQQQQPVHAFSTSQSAAPMITLQPSTSLPPAPPAPPRQKPPAGILNPILAGADFTMPQHPYQSYYVAPNPMHHSQYATYQ